MDPDTEKNADADMDKSQTAEGGNWVSDGLPRDMSVDVVATNGHGADESASSQRTLSSAFGPPPIALFVLLAA